MMQCVCSFRWSQTKCFAFNNNLVYVLCNVSGTTWLHCTLLRNIRTREPCISLGFPGTTRGVTSTVQFLQGKGTSCTKSFLSVIKFGFIFRGLLATLNFGKLFEYKLENEKCVQIF